MLKTDITDHMLRWGRRQPRGTAAALASTVARRGLQILICTVIFTVLFSLFPGVAEAQRIRDLAKVKGIRPVHLTGIGLVIGLNGTGDSQRNEVLKQYYVQVLSNMGTGISPTLTDVKTRNAALVMVNATLPSSMKPGTEFEVTVSSIGDAESLRDGYLLAVPMKLPYAYEPGEGEVYGEAHGTIYSGQEDADKITKARTRAVLTAPLEQHPLLSNLEDITLLLDKPDFGTSSEIARRINGFDLFRNLEEMSPATDLAMPLDSSTVRVRIPTSYLVSDRIIDFISHVLEIEVADVEREAMVAIDRQKGSVVVNGGVLVSLPAFIKYKGAMIRIPATMKKNEDGEEDENEQSPVTERQQLLLVDVIDQLENPAFEFTGMDVIHILEQMNRVGAIRGKFVER